jgi:hypothetical protein
MSEQPTAPPPRAGTAPAPAGGGNWFTDRSLGGIPNWAWISLAALATVGFILWRRSKNQATTAAQQQQAQAPAGTVTGTTAGTCYDASGNTVPCTQADYASQIAALQAEIDNMQGTPSVPVQTAATSGTTGAASTATATPTVSTQPIQPGVGTVPSSGTATPVTTSTGTGG